MENIENNLFFSRKDRRIFYIAGYSVTNPCAEAFLSGNSLVEDIKKDLDKGVAEFLRIVKTSPKEVYTTVVFKSQHYKGMSVFYCYINENNVPKEACILNDTMKEILTS